MRIGVLGTGAVGGLYGGKLHAAGLEVHFLARSDYNTLIDNGLRIKSNSGTQVLAPLLVHNSIQNFPVCDFILVAWKTTANPASLAALLKPVTHGESTVVILQNGLDPECDVQNAVRPEQLLSGLCFLCCRREGPGRIWHQDYGALTLAQFRPHQAGGMTPRLEKAAEVLKACGEEIKCAPDWREARWRKLVWNIAFNGPTALANRDTRAWLSEKSGEALSLGLMEEVISGARRLGLALPEGLAGQMLGYTRKMVAYAPSMMLDAQAKRPMEVEAIYTRPLAAIIAAGGSAPLLGSVEALLRGLNQSFAGE